MTYYTVFTTPGELDLTALTTFGVNHKPNSQNPIGYFGTGLKYAIAVLLRHNIPVTIYTGGQEYHFYTKETDFRGKTFKTCRYKAKGLWKGWKYVELPFTTELGKHWQLWQAFRELYSNTLDESGGMFVTTHTEDLRNDYKPPRTLIVVGGQEFADVVTKMDEVFLPKDKLKLVAASKDVEVYEGSSRYVYYRGLRAYDLNAWEKESMYTYNYIGSATGLTEDRTIKYIFYVRDAIADLVAKSDDRKLIGTYMKVGDRWFEKGLDFNAVYSKSDTFNSVIYRMGSSPVFSSMPSSARTYYTDVLRDAPKVGKGLEVSDEVWQAIQEAFDKADEENPVDRYSGLEEKQREYVAKALNRWVEPEPIPMVSLFTDGDDIPF